MKLDLDDGLGILGEVHAFVFDGDLDESQLEQIIADRSRPEWSRLASESFSPNLVSTVGRSQMTKIIVGETTALCGYCALSTSTITPAIADTSLPTEKIRQAVSTRKSISGGIQQYLTYFVTTSFGSTGIAAEGLFDATSSGGNMWADATVTISKSTTQSLLIDHRITATT